jgi:hypothetical protein
MYKLCILSAFLLVGVVVSMAQSPTDSLIAYYKFDENLFDSSGADKHLTIGDGSISWTTDRFGNTNKAIVLDGASRVERNNFPEIHRTDGQEFTLCYWFNPSSWEGSSSIVSNRDDPNGINWGSGREYSSGKIGFGGLPSYVLSQGPPPLNCWTFFAVTITSSGAGTIYINGTLNATQSDCHFRVYDPTEIKHLCIGSNPGNAEYYSGLVDDVRIYNRTLSEAEVQTLYHEGPSITLLSPNGGENWAVGTTHNITWTSVNVDNLNLDYSTDNGSTWNSIATSVTANAGSYLWTIPNHVTDECRVRISDALHSTVNDTNNAAFHIVATMLEDDLVAYYKFDENLFDSSGADKHLTIGDGSISWTMDRFGNMNKAIVLDGASRVERNNFPEIHRADGQEFTLCYWFNPSSWGGGSNIVSNRDDPNGLNWASGCDEQSGGKIGLGGTPPYFLSLAPPASNRWTFFAVTINSSGVGTIYINGTLHATQSNFHFRVYDPTEIKHLCIGSNPGNAEYYSGLVDDVRIYNRAFSDSEINQLYGNFRQRVTSVSDIPNDQGGKVRITWSKIYLDSSGVSNQITSYGVWRKIPAGGTVSKRMPSTLAIMNDTLGLLYDYLGTVNAVQSPGYHFIAQTLDDSSSSGTYEETYLVTAHTSDPNVYYISDPATGHSVDNLAPAAIQSLTAELQSGPSVLLTWDKNTVDHDFNTYQVYRSHQSDFTPGDESKIGAVTDNAYNDNAVVPGYRYYYRVLSVDIHGNMSPLSPRAVAGVEGMHTYSFTLGWKIVSVPIDVADARKSALFPNIESSAFEYDRGYLPADTLYIGGGYWIKCTDAAPVSISGYYFNTLTIAVKQGWNMIGSISIPIAVGNVGSIESDISVSSFFDYTDHGYATTDSLNPGRGYWVKVSEDCHLVLASPTTASMATDKIRIVPTSELPPAPPSTSGENNQRENPKTYSLSQNYPNPFNPVTTISYALPQSVHVTLGVYNTLGERVALLVDGEQQAGYHNVELNGSGLASGVYFYRIQAGSFMDVKKLVLMK